MRIGRIGAARAARSLALSLPALLMAASQAGAQTSEISEVVVSARKTEEKLRDVPIAATVVDAQIIADQGGARTLQELLANTPAVYFLNTSSPTNSEVTMRGSGTGRATTAETAVGLYRNGAYVGGGSFGGRSFARLDLFDLERVEVLRGTQGALYGRNAVGGAINVITQQPKFERSGQVLAQYASKDYRQGDLILNANLSEHVAVRLSASFIDQSKAFFFNPTQGQYYDEQKTGTERFQIRYAKDRFDGNLLVEHYQANLPAIIFQVVIPVGTNAAYPRGYAQDPYAFPHNGPMAAKQQVNAVQATWSYDLGFAQLSSSTLRRVRRTLSTFDQDALDPAELARIRAELGVTAVIDPNGANVTRDTTKSWFQDLHLSGELGERANWLFGAEYLKFRSKGDITQTRTPTATLSQGTVAPLRLDVRSISAYGLLGYDLTETLNITGEARYTTDKRSVDINRFDLRTGLSAGSRFAAVGSVSPANFNYTLSAGWKFDPAWLLYAKVGTAFRAASFNTDLGDPRGLPIPFAYDDEQAITYEAGIKGNIIPPLFVALTTYFAKTRDAQVQRNNGCAVGVPACPVPATLFLTNSGDKEVRGVELEVSYRTDFLGGRMRANLGLTAQEGEFVSGPDAGKKVNNLPATGIKGSVNYRRPITERVTGFINVRYDGEWGGNQEIGPTIPVPFTTPLQLRIAELADRQLVDLRLGVTFGGTELAFYSDNVTDETYLIFKSATTDRRNTPRRVGVQVTRSF